MKRRFSKILGVGLTLALVTSLLLVAAPVSADVSQPTVSLDDDDISATTTYAVSFNLGKELVSTACEIDARDIGTATVAWVTDAPTGYTGTTAAKFTLPASPDWDDMAIAQVGYNRALSTITTEADLTFTYYSQVGAPDPFPSLYMDTDDNGLVDFALGGKRTAIQTSGEWVTTEPYVDANPWNGCPVDEETGVVTNNQDWQTLEYWKTDGGEDPGALAGATVLYVALEYGGPTNHANAVLYVDKMTINNSVYDLEEEPAENTITIVFPEDTSVPLGSLDDATIQASPGWIRGRWDNATTTDVTFEGDDEELTVIATLGDGDEIGEGATVRIEVPGITNPDDAGYYTLEVSTSAEDELVESEEYEIEVPEIGVLPGIVEVYNPSDVLMASYTGNKAIDNAIGKADEDWTIKIGEGLYIHDLETVEADVTIEGSGDVEDIIIEGIFIIATEGITIDGITLDGDGANNALVVDVGGIDFTLKNCILEDADVALIDVGAGSEDDPTVIDDCTFNIEDEIGVDVGTAGVYVEITDCTFTVDEDGDGVGIEINADADVEVTDCIFNGGSGVGVEVNGGDSAIEGCTFDGLLTAFDINGGTADIFGGTIINCEEEAITVAGATTLVTIHNNTITGNDEAVILDVADGLADKVFMMFNTITDNAGDDDGLLINNNHTGEDLVVANNWWGDADGPGDDAFSDDVASEPFLSGPITSSALEANLLAGKTADFEDACGVQVDNDGTGTVDIIAAAQYTTSPVAAIDDAVGFWDVFCVIDESPVDKVTLRIYTDVTEDTELWVWGEARGEWLEAEAATPNLFGGFMWIEITDTSTPTLDDLAGLPFAVVEPPAAVELDVDPGELELLTPTVGDDTVSLTPTFAWSAVADADGYYFQFADNANFVTPLVKLDGDLGRLIVTAYAYVTELPYSTAYYWRVKAVSGTEAAGDLKESAWVSGVFITKAEPVEPTPPVVIEPYEPPEIVIEQPDIIVPLPAETPITPAWIYVIIAVGAVLVIGLIVLIVRTRRVA